MRRWRVLIWLYPALVIAGGIGFLIWSFEQARSANAYRNAPECGAEVTASCYQLFPGQITSVQVSQTREGERDDVVIQTASHGILTATLEPTASAAPHVRTGAQVTAKLYGGQVTLVAVDDFAVASTANPIANQNNASFDGWLLIGLGVLSFGVPFYSIWRRRRVAEGQSQDALAAGGQLEPELLASGSLGWSIRPRRSLSTIGRYAFVMLLVLGFSYPALVDPARARWAIGLDLVVLVGMVALLALFLRNDRIFADRFKVGKTNLFGRTVSLPVNEVLRADRFSVPSRYGRNRHLVFVRADGRMAFEVAGPNWNYRELEHLCREAGIRLSGGYDELVGAFKLNQRVRGITNWGQQLMWGLILVVFIVAYVALLAGPSRR